MAKGKAIIIVGINRGGTSAVASSLNALGVFLGNNGRAPIFEDRDLSTAFRERDWKKLKQIADTYASMHDLYAWKLPDTRHRLQKIEKYIDDARFIFVFRDVFAIAQRKQKSLGEDPFKSLSGSLKSYSDLVKFAKKRHKDHLFVSYEKILTDPESYATRLLDFIGYEQSPVNIKKIIDVIGVSPPDYNVWADSQKQSSTLEKQFALKGRLHRADSKVIVGWAKWKNTDDPVELVLRINDTEFTTLVANQFQQHLVNSGFSTSGNRGFRIETPVEIAIGAEIAVLEKNSGAHLAGSPMKIA